MYLVVFLLLGGTSSILRTFWAEPVKKNTLYVGVAKVWLDNLIQVLSEKNHKKLRRKIPKHIWPQSSSDAIKAFRRGVDVAT